METVDLTPALYMQREPLDTLQSSFLRRFLIALHLIACLELRPVLKAHAALGALSDLRDVFLDVLEGGKRAWHPN